MFNGNKISIICDWIILIGGTFVAINTILSWFGKPISFAKNRRKILVQKTVEEILKEKMPGALKQHDERLAKEIGSAIVETLQPTIDEIKKVNKSQSLLVENQQKTSLDILRLDLNRIYYKYQPYKKILDFDKQAFIKLYEDYVALHGNTYVQTLYEEVLTWEVVKSWKELKEI